MVWNNELIYPIDSLGLMREMVLFHVLLATGTLLAKMPNDCIGEWAVSYPVLPP
jgi:hypothetical protein